MIYLWLRFRNYYFSIELYYDLDAKLGSLILDLIKMTVLVFFITHTCTCFWALLGRLKNIDSTWIDVYM